MHTRTMVVIAAGAVCIASAVVVLASRHNQSSPTGSAPRRASGKIVVVSRRVPQFSRVVSDATADVRVTVGKHRAVTVRGDKDVVPLIGTKVRGNTLVISDRSNFSTRDGVTVVVTTSDLSAATFAGTGSMRVAGVRATSFAAALDGTGAFSVTGRTTSLNMRLSGTGAAELRGLSAADARVLLSGTGDIHLVATRSINARVSGTGNVLYTGNPATVRQSVVGTGSIVGS